MTKCIVVLALLLQLLPVFADQKCYKSEKKCKDKCDGTCETDSDCDEDKPYACIEKGLSTGLIVFIVIAFLIFVCCLSIGVCAFCPCCVLYKKMHKSKEGKIINDPNAPPPQEYPAPMEQYPPPMQQYPPPMQQHPPPMEQQPMPSQLPPIPHKEPMQPNQPSDVQLPPIPDQQPIEPYQSMQNQPEY